MSSITGNLPKKVALVEWAWGGHHPTYFNHLLLAFEELGIEVLALCPDPDGAAETVRLTRQKTQPATTMQFVKFESPAWRFGRLGLWISGMIWTSRHFLRIEKTIREHDDGNKVEAIFYPSIQAWNFDLMNLVQPFLRLPWMGIYIHALPYRTPGYIHPRVGRVSRPQVMFSGRLCKGLGVLDEGIVQQVTNSIGKPVVAFPDPTDDRLPENTGEDSRARQLKEFAAGRPIVGLFGVLLESKGVNTFLEAAALFPESEVCFALGGFVVNGPEGKLGWEIRDALKKHGHIWHHADNMAEPVLNHLLAACDVIVAAYWDFPHSSGIQTKAAMLKKPLIVSDGYLMAERARRYGIAEVVPQKDPQALRDAIVEIIRNPAKWTDDHRPQWAEYYSLHSPGQVKTSLNKLLTAAL